MGSATGKGGCHAILGGFCGGSLALKDLTQRQSNPSRGGGELGLKKWFFSRANICGFFLSFFYLRNAGLRTVRVVVVVVVVVVVGEQFVKSLFLSLYTSDL